MTQEGKSDSEINDSISSKYKDVLDVVEKQVFLLLVLDCVDQ